MQTYRKKRLEIIIEAPALGRLIELLDEAEVTGYTVLPAITGRGVEGSWQREGMVGDAGRQVVVVCIVDPDRLPPLLETLRDLIERYIAVLSIAEVEVLRDEHF